MMAAEFGAMSGCIEREGWVVYGGGTCVCCVCAIHDGRLLASCADVCVLCEVDKGRV